MGPLTYFFGFDGRIRRTHWWIATLSLGVLPVLLYTVMIISLVGTVIPTIDFRDEAAVRAAVETALASTGPAYLAMFALLILLIMVGQFSLNMRRYHDRNKSGWWAWLGWSPYIVVVTCAALNIPNAFAITLFILMFLVIPIWQLIELGFLGGTPGGNDYGPDPRGGLGHLAGELAALRGAPAPEAGNRVWSQNRDASPLYAPVMAAAAPPASMPPRSGPPVFGKRH